MKRISTIIHTITALTFALTSLIGCGATPPRVEGPTTSSWTEADDAALGIAPAPTDEATSGGEAH